MTKNICFLFFNPSVQFDLSVRRQAQKSFPMLTPPRETRIGTPRISQSLFRKTGTWSCMQLCFKEARFFEQTRNGRVPSQKVVFHECERCSRDSLLSSMSRGSEKWECISWQWALSESGLRTTIQPKVVYQHFHADLTRERCNGKFSDQRSKKVGIVRPIN